MRKEKKPRAKAAAIERMNFFIVLKCLSCLSLMTPQAQRLTSRHENFSKKLSYLKATNIIQGQWIVNLCIIIAQNTHSD